MYTHQLNDIAEKTSSSLELIHGFVNLIKSSCRPEKLFHIPVMDSHNPELSGQIFAED